MNGNGNGNGGDDPWGPPGSPEYNARWRGVAQGTYDQPPEEGIYAPNAGFFAYPFIGRGSTPLAPGLTPEQLAEVTRDLYAKGWAPRNTQFPRGLGTMGIIGNVVDLESVSGSRTTKEIVRLERDDSEASDVCVNISAEGIKTANLIDSAQIRARWGSGGFQGDVTFDAIHGTQLNFTCASLYIEAIVPDNVSGNFNNMRVGVTLGQGTRSAGHDIYSTDYATIGAASTEVFAVPKFADAVIVSRSALSNAIDIEQLDRNPGDLLCAQEYAASTFMESFWPLSRRTGFILVRNNGVSAIDAMVTFRLAL